MMQYEATLSGHGPGPQDAELAIVRVVLEHLAEELKSIGHSGDIVFGGKTLHFHPGDGIIWD